MSGIQYNINQIPYGNIVAFVATDESIPKIEQIIYGYHQLRKFPIKYIITDEPKHDGVIVARRFNIGNFGTNAIVTINKLLYKKTNEDAIEAFSKVVKAGMKAEPDLIIIETMNDPYELKAAIIAAKEKRKLLNKKYRSKLARLGKVDHIHSTAKVSFFIVL